MIAAGWCRNGRLTPSNYTRIYSPRSADEAIAGGGEESVPPSGATLVETPQGVKLVTSPYKKILL